MELQSYRLRTVYVILRKLLPSFHNVIFRAEYWFRCWAQLQRCDEDGELMKVACRRLETTVM
uniref:Uncharacterized protein n=1 Tax=Oryza sativa subsp. japonica TaxID=39947 RepID=Q10FA8_ORYSJ|nr:hypothetical protein LOC_Os03g47149 [Oryza sativa Japonica Group]